MGALARGLETFNDQLPQPRVCLAHSMGGAIALAAIAQGLVKVDAAAFSAPMWGLKSKFFGMSYLVWAMRATGRSGDYAIQPGPPERFENNIVTHDKRRWEMQRDLIEAEPDLELGPVTWGDNQGEPFLGRQILSSARSPGAGSARRWTSSPPSPSRRRCRKSRSRSFWLRQRRKSWSTMPRMRRSRAA